MSDTPNGRDNRGIDRRLFNTALAASLGTAAFGLPLQFARAAQPLKIGLLLPRSGSFALTGQDCQRGADLAVSVLRDMGHSIELMNADTETNPDVGRTQAEKLIREGAHVLVGAFDSGTTGAIAQVAEQRGVPMIINVGADPKITQQGYKYVFRNFPTSIQLGTGGLQMISKLFDATGYKPTSAVLMHTNDTFGVSMLNGVKALMPKLNLPFEIKEVIGYDPRAKDLSVEVAKAKSVGADLHLVVVRVNDAVLMIREMVKQRYNPAGIISPGGPGLYEKPFFRALGKHANYCVTNVLWFNPKQPLTKELQKRFTKQWPDETFGMNVGCTFEAIYVAANAYKQAGSSAPQALTEAIRATKLSDRVMTGGPIEFDAYGQNNNNETATVQNIDGRPEVVLPTSSALHKPVFPVPAWSKRT